MRWIKKKRMSEGYGIFHLFFPSHKFCFTIRVSPYVRFSRMGTQGNEKYAAGWRFRRNEMMYDRRYTTFLSFSLFFISLSLSSYLYSFYVLSSFYSSLTYLFLSASSCYSRVFFVVYFALNSDFEEVEKNVNLVEEE